MEAWNEIAKLPETPRFWIEFFHPKHTSWGDVAAECMQDKVDALRVLFLENPHFLRNGTHVVRQFMAWCDEQRDGARDYRLCDVKKAKAFLEFRVERAQERWSDDVETGVVKHNTVAECAMNAFRSAICHLNALAKWQGYNLQLLEHEQIQVLRDFIARKQNTARAAPRDYAASSRFLTKRLTQEEMDGITMSWWDGSAAVRVASSDSGRERAQVRGLLFHCLQKTIGRRGDELRNLRNAMFFLHALQNTSPVSPCMAIGASLRHVKECTENVEHLIGWVRSKDRMSCPIGALACYFVWMIDIARIPILEEIQRDADKDTGTHVWWKRMLFVTDVNADVNETPMSYATHHKSVHAGYDAIGAVGKTAATQIYRTTRACDDLESGAPFLDVGVYQGWYHDNAADVYLRGAFKSAAMLRASGWDNGMNGFTCWWEGDDRDIPSSMKAIVFSGLDDALCERERLYASSGIDRSSVEFLKVLRYLRKVFLEDAVHKRAKHPNFPAYARHPVFQLPEWPEFCEEEKKRQMERENVATKNTQDQHARLSALVQTTVESTMKTVLGDVLSQHAASQRKVVPPTNEPIELPKTTIELPEIPEPTCLYTCYQTWQQHRSYFYSTPLPPWKKRFGERAATMKLRYSRMRPFLMYIDRCGASARRVLDALDAFRKERSVSASVFIKHCFYHLEYELKPDCKKPPPILPHEMREFLQRGNLPAFNT